MGDGAEDGGEEAASSPLGRLAKLIRGLGSLTGLTPLLDKLVSQSEVVLVEGRKCVRKRYLKEVGIIKWIPPAILFRATYPFTLSPRERFRREVSFLKHSWVGIGVPKIIEADERKLELVREFVDGDLINYFRDAERVAEALGRIHREGWALGDVKPTNFLSGHDGLIYVIDAEQAVSTSGVPHRAWDVALTAFFAAYSNLPDLNAYEAFLRKFLRKYVSTYGGVEVLREVSNFHFGGIFLLLPLPHTFTLADVIEDVINEFG